MASSSSLFRNNRRRIFKSIAGVTTTTTAGALCYAQYRESTATSTLPRAYHRESIHSYWNDRPISVLSRLVHVVYELTPCAVTYLVDFKIQQQQSKPKELYKLHAIRLRDALTRLGPAFVKAGQQLSIRPDLVPAVVLKELQKLCDAVEPIDDEIALQVLRDELECDDLSTLFTDLHLVASASLGQVYKAQLVESGEDVAIKVQRPMTREAFSLDLYLLQKWGACLDGLFTTVTKQAAYHYGLFDTFSKGSYGELDYQQEAANQIDFKRELQRRHARCKVPAVKCATEKVLVSEWIHGIRLADAPADQIRELIPDGVELFLIQLLDYGRFHADPHPGNLYVTTNGKDGKPTLCLLDFGLCSDIEESARAAMTNAIVHLLTGDFDALVAHDAKELGFLPHDLNTDELKPILKTILTKGLLESGSNLQMRKRKLMDISNELNDVFFKYPFSVPPFFALVTRGLGLLEGIALTGDPNFDIFQASLPYARKRAALMTFGTARRDTAIAAAVMRRFPSNNSATTTN